MKKLEKGFTLIELMIVVAIIAILAAVAAPKFGQQLKKSKDAKALAVVGNWRSGLNLAYADNEVYETTFSSILQNQVDKGTLGATTIAAGGATGTIPVGTGDTGNTITVGFETGSSSTQSSIVISSTSKDTKGTTWSTY